MSLKIYITTLTAVIVLYLGSLFIILNSKVVNKDTINNEFKSMKPKKNSSIVIDLDSETNDTTIKYKKKWYQFKKKRNE